MTWLGSNKNSVIYALFMCCITLGHVVSQFKYSHPDSVEDRLVTTQFDEAYLSRCVGTETDAGMLVDLLHHLVIHPHEMHISTSNTTPGEGRKQVSTSLYHTV